VGGGHYFERSPAAPSQRSRVRLSLPDVELELVTDRGVFSPGRVDLGTQVLLRKAPAPPPTGTLLDLGCGYGPIALTLGCRAPGATVWAVDVNERAIGLTADNATAAGLSNVRVALAGEVPDDIRFDAIYSNPPIRIGKDALHDLLSGWLARLAPGGTAWLVVQRHLGSDSLAAWLTSEGWSVAKHASQKGYRVLAVTAS
jgi:16S rRNA (guanine1207-N2)-methyltransferase